MSAQVEAHKSLLRVLLELPLLGALGDLLGLERCGLARSRRDVVGKRGEARTR